MEVCPESESCAQSQPFSSYIAVVGPTASGKSSLAMRLARELDGEIINCDSIQVYQGFDIGSAKASLSEREQVPHHLIDLLQWNEPFDASLFASQAKECIRDISERGKLAVLVGGTGLYLRSLMGQCFHTLPTDPRLRVKLNQWPKEQVFDELKRRDPTRAKAIHPNDQVRLVRSLEIALLTGQSFSQATALSNQPTESKMVPKMIIYIDVPRAQLHDNIYSRCQGMIKNGLIAEVESLLKAGCPTQAKPMQAIGYRHIVAYLDGSVSKSQCIDDMVAATRQFAKRQTTWFKGIANRTVVTPSTKFSELTTVIQDRCRDLSHHSVHNCVRTV